MDCFPNSHYELSILLGYRSVEEPGTGMVLQIVLQAQTWDFLGTKSRKIHFVDQQSRKVWR
jgi:hypothetical protein